MSEADDAYEARGHTMTIEEARALLAVSAGEAYMTVAVEVVRAFGEDAIPLMSPIDWGWCKAIINAEDGTGPMWSVPMMTEVKDGK